MRPYSAYDSDTCSIARTLALIGDRWTLLVLRDVANGVRRFDELAGHLGIARNILASRLKRLVSAGLPTREDAGPGRRAAYSLTEASIQLVPVFVQLGEWGPAPPPDYEAAAGASRTAHGRQPGAVA